MINPFVWKKNIALILSPLLTTTAFYCVLVFYNFWLALGSLGLCILLFWLVSNLMLKNPFTMMLEGKGILALDISSTGIIQPFIVNVNSPFIQGNLNNRTIKDSFDREAVFNLAEPIKAGNAQFTSDKKIKIELDEESYNRGKFALYHYPMLIYNSQISSILTKDFLAAKEKDTFAEHGVLYLNRKMEELTSVVRDFGRAVVEMLKPQGKGFGSWWVWLILGILLVGCAVIFLPNILEAFKGVNPSSILGGSTSAIVPKG